MKNINSLQALEELLSQIETEVKRARLFLQQMDGVEKNTDVKPDFDSSMLKNIQTWAASEWAVQVVEGVFDGFFMLGTDEKRYPVPLNYSSKTKLIPGDVLKLRIMEDGKLIYKLTSPANKQYLKASLTKSDDNKFSALADDGKYYILNQAAVSYYKANVGDEITIIINADGLGNVAAIEAVITQ
jgi:hypothetical protein